MAKGDLKGYFEFIGLDRLWKNWSVPWVKAETKVTMGRVVTQAQGVAQKYPRQNPRSTYRRTKTLGRSITKEVAMVPYGVVGVVGSNIPYAKVVNDGHGVILPRKGRVLSWVATKSGGGAKAGQRIFARRVGPWAGWHNFDKAIEQGKAVMLMELRSLVDQVTKRLNSGG